MNVSWAAPVCEVGNSIRPSASCLRIGQGNCGHGQREGQRSDGDRAEHGRGPPPGSVAQGRVTDKRPQGSPFAGDPRPQPET